MFKKLYNKVKNLTLTAKEKAFMGGLVTAVSTYLAQNPGTLKEVWSIHGLWALVAGIVCHQAVYWTSNTNLDG